MVAICKRREAVVVTQFYRPEVIGSGPFVGDIAEALSRDGWRVRVLTVRPHYPDGIVFPSYRSGERDRVHLNGVEVRRMPTRERVSDSTRNRLVSESSFLLRGLATLLSHRVRRGELVVSLCPSIFAVLLGDLFARPGGTHIGVVHDIQSGLASGLGMTGGASTRVLRAIERHALNRCTLLIVLSEDMRRRLRDNGVIRPIHVLPIWTDTDTIRPCPTVPGEARTALYSGNLGRKQGLMQLIHLAEALRDRQSGLRITIRGRGSQADAIDQAISERALDNISRGDLMAPEQLPDLLGEGDIHLVPQDPAVADYAVPSKIYSIMAAARPFVATANDGSPLSRLQRESGAFLCVPPNDPETFATTVMSLARNEALRNDLGRRGRSYVRAHCAKDKCLARLCAAAATGMWE